MIVRRGVHVIAGAVTLFGALCQAQSPTVEDSVMIRVVNTELRSAVQLMSQYLDKPVIFSGSNGALVSLETPRAVPRASVVRLLRGLLDSQGFELNEDTAAGLYRARAKPQAVQPASASSTFGPPPSSMSARAATNAELFVVPLKHARAIDLAATINALYGRGAAGGDSQARPSTLSDELRANLLPNSSAGAMTGGLGATSGAGVFRGNGLSGELVVVPDARANSLLIRSNRADFELIQSIVGKLDVRPLQVLIEVLIAEVRRDFSFGVNVEADLAATTVGRNGAVIQGSAGSTGVGDFVLKVMRLGGLNLDATLHVASQHGNVRILSRPVVIAANNQQAVITVGSQRPFVQVQRSLPTDQATRDQVVQYKDVGTKLTVRPTISIDGSVQLDVTQEVSNATTETAFNAPIIATRSVQTQLLIRDGQTVALGGLTDQQRDVSSGGVPLLSRLPLLGGLFGHQRRESSTTELFVFLTPRVLRNDDDADRVSTPLRERATGAKP